MKKPLLNGGSSSSSSGGGGNNGTSNGKGYGSSNGRARNSTLGGSFASCRGSTDEALLRTRKDGTLLPLTSPLKGGAVVSTEDGEGTCGNAVCSFLYDLRWHSVTLVVIVASFLVAYYCFHISARDLLVYGTIPLISMAFTFGHIWLALQMVGNCVSSEGRAVQCSAVHEQEQSVERNLHNSPPDFTPQTFYPLEFWGIPLIVFEGQPFGICGWQGIIPAKAEKMASKAVDLMTTKLLCVQDVFARLDPARVADITGPVLHELLGEIIEATALEEAPGVWALLPTPVKEDVVAHAMEDAPEAVEALMNEIRNNIEEVFDLKNMVINNLMRDKDMLNQVFLRCGKDELNFIKVLGGYLGESSSTPEEELLRGVERSIRHARLWLPRSTHPATHSPRTAPRRRANADLHLLRPDQ